MVADAAARIKAGRPGKVTVTGYTDKVAGQPVNEKLSAQRADNIADALKAAIGPGSTMIVTAAKGETEPVASNDSATGRQQNRRATITSG